VNRPIALVDMEIGNLASVLHALRRINAPAHVLATSQNLCDASAILIPGVGAFGDGMASLTDKGLVEPIRRAAQVGVPVFGICLGMQLLAEQSEEFGAHKGLGLIAGEVRRLDPKGTSFRVPNVGWCDVAATRSSVLFPECEGCCCYHVHSYHFVPSDPGVTVATIDFAGTPHVVAVECGNLFGVQFHPEKSQSDGLQVLANFFAALPQMRRPR
jgi:glutamine amidotransferase